MRKILLMECVRQNSHVLKVLGQCLFLVAGAGFLIACGTYNQVIYMLPQADDRWVQPTGGDLARQYDCHGRPIIMRHSVISSRKAARAFFWVPVPGTASEDVAPSIQDPLRIKISFGLGSEANSCEKDLIWIRGLTATKNVFPSGVAQESHSVRTGHFCTYQFVPMDQIGDEFSLYFSNRLYGCEVPPLRFRRYDGTVYVPAFLP